MSKNFTLFTAHLFLPLGTVKKRMEQRRMMRRARRGRGINRKIEFSQRAHRQKRFSSVIRLPEIIKYEGLAA